MKIEVKGNEENVRKMLIEALNEKNNLTIEYYNGEKFEGNVHSFTLNNEMTGKPFIENFSIYVKDDIMRLDISQIQFIY